MQWAFLATGMLLLIALPHSTGFDGAERYRALVHLLQGTVSPVKYSMVGPLFALPLMGLGAIIRNPVGITASFNTFVLLLGMCVLYVALVRRLAPEVVRSFLLILLFGSMMPAHALVFYGEMFTAVAIACGSALVVLAGVSSGWVWMLLGVANVPMAIVGYGLLTVRRALHTKRLRILILPLVAIALILLESKLRRGGFLLSGYAGEHGKASVLPYTASEGFHFPLVVGFLSLTLSFGKGILFFAPGLLAVPSFLRSSTDAAVRHLLELWMWFVLGLLLVVSMWYSWQGGWFWGPRFLLVAVFPASLALAWQVHRVRTLPGCIGTLVLLLLSFWVGFSGLIFNQRDMGLCLMDKARLEPLCWYTPEFSALGRPFVTGSLFHMNPFELGIAILWTGAFFCTAWPVLVNLRLLIPDILRTAWAKAGRNKWRI